MDVSGKGRRRTMKFRKILIAALAVSAVLVAGYFIGSYGFFTPKAYAHSGEVIVTEVSEKYSVIQVIDQQRKVICYGSNTPSGAGISCVKY